MLFIGFPQYVETALQRFPGLQQRIEAVAISYLEEQKGKDLIGRQVDAAVHKYLLSESGQERIRTQTEAYLKGQVGSELVAATVSKHMEGEKVTEEIRSAVDTALKSFRDNMSGKIQHRLNDLVSSTESYDEPESLAKGNIQMLENFIRENRAVIIGSNSPLVLTIVLGKEIHYDQNVIKDYINILSREFKDQFRNILILDKDEKFIALIERDVFLQKLNTQVQEEFLNKNISRREARVYLENKVKTKKFTFAVKSSQSFFETLTMEDWKDVNNEGEVAVIDSNGKFKGVTSWNRLLDGLVG
jgi:hypothetical protein